MTKNWTEVEGRGFLHIATLLRFRRFSKALVVLFIRSTKSRHAKVSQKFMLKIWSDVLYSFSTGCQVSNYSYARGSLKNGSASIMNWYFKIFLTFIFSFWLSSMFQIKGLGWLVRNYFCLLFMQYSMYVTTIEFWTKICIFFISVEMFKNPWFRP